MGGIGWAYAGLHIGHAFSGQRVAAQVRVAASVVQARGLLQLFKHAYKTLLLKTGLGHHAKAHAVGLALHIARKIKLTLGRHRLTTYDKRVSRVGAFAGRQRAQYHGAYHPRCLLGLARNHARYMPLGDVADLMCQYRRQFVPTIHHAYQPQVHAKVGAGQGKGIHRAVTPQKHLPRIDLVQLGRQLAAQARCPQQGLPYALQIVHDDRVIHIVRVAVEFSGNAVAQSALGSRGHGGTVAQIGQGVSAGRAGGAGLRLGLCGG